MKNLICFALICISSCAAFSQTKQQSIAEFIQLTRTDLLIDQAFNRQLPAIPNLPAATPEQQARFAEMRKISQQLALTLMQRFMDEELVSLYDKHYTHAEIKDYIAFYKSPSGQKLINAGPALQKDIQDIMAAKYLPDLMKEFMKRAEELRSK